MGERTEYDSVGSMGVPDDAYYGIQSLRAFRNFHITGRTLSDEFIVSLAQVKKAAAVTNYKCGNLDYVLSKAIVRACDEIINGRFHEQFIVDPIQGGAGTSANMNANEVIANRACELLGGVKGSYVPVHPNDHVNMSQSTNDVFPTVGKLTALKLMPKLIFQLKRLANALDKKSHEFGGIVKMGRTQLQDAVPVSLGQEFSAYSCAVKRDVIRLEKAQDELRTVNMGGTAIGTSINASPEYVADITENLKKITGIEITQAENMVDGTQNLDCFAFVSGTLKTCAVSLSKISNDLRLLSSGPRTGITEIFLPAVQNGSSIMPGKINPVIPEVVTQTAFNVIGNDCTVALAAEAGQMELNAFEPVLFYKTFESIKSLTGAVCTLVDNCVCGITANEESCAKHLRESVGTVTALCPYIGYEKSAGLAKESLKTGIPVATLALNCGALTKSQLEKVLDPVSMTGCRKLSVLGKVSVRERSGI